MGIRNVIMAADLARMERWSGVANSDYEKGPELRYGDSLEGLNSNGDVVPMFSVNSTSHPELGPQTELGTPTLAGSTLSNQRTITARLPGTQPATAANYGAFAVMELAGVIQSVKGFHETAGDDAGAVTLDIEKLTGTQAPGAGVAVLGATKINLKATANTQQAPALTGTGANKTVAVGDRLALKLTGTPANVAGLLVSIVILPT